MSSTLQYSGINTNKGRSPGLWKDCPWEAITQGVDNAFNGRWTHIDFSKFKLSTNINAAVAYWDQGCLAFGSNGFAVSAVDELGGWITFGSDGDNEGGSIQQTCFPYQIIRTGKSLWFEARVRFSTVAATTNGLFVGLGESMTLGATVPIQASGAMADQNLVGWHRLEANGNRIDFKYKANGVTEVTLGSDVLALSASTWYKLGFKYRPQDPQYGANKLSWYINGTYYGSYTLASAAGTDFPNDVRMSPLIASLNATGSSPGTNDVSDIWCAQITG
jgi:hypothetical protein